MSSPCDPIREQLVELVYDELDPSCVDSVMAHLDSCPECREALSDIRRLRRIAATIPETAFPASLETPILDLARQAAATRCEPTAPVILMPLRDRVRSIARPGMAIVGLAAAALIGLIWQMDEKPHQRLIAPMNGAPFEGAVRRDTPDDPHVEPTRWDREAPGGDPMVAQRYRRPEAGTHTEPPTQLPKPEVGPPKPRVEPSTVPSASAKRAAPSPIPQMGSTHRDDMSMVASEAKSTLNQSRALSAPAVAESMQTVSPQTGDASPSLNPPLSSERTSYENDLLQALTHYRSGNCPAAVGVFEKILSTDSDRGRRATALHHMGRCESRTGRCSQAVPHYERLFREFPDYPRRSESMIEAASCYGRIGQVRRARTLLEEVARDPEWTSRAQTELERLSH